MDKVTVTTADREAAEGRHGQFCNAFGPTPMCCSCGIEKAFARHRIEATRQAEEQIKLLREALTLAGNRFDVCVVNAIADGRHAECNHLKDWRDEITQALEATNGIGIDTHLEGEE